MVCKNGQYGYINEEGEEIIPCIYNELIYVSELIVILKKDESINNEEFKYDEVYSFHEEGAVVCKNGKYGYINKKGDEIVGCIYEDAGYFSSGMAKVYKGENEQCFIDINGTELELKGYEYTAPYYSDGLLVVKKNDKYGYVNRDGTKLPWYKGLCKALIALVLPVLGMYFTSIYALIILVIFPYFINIMYFLLTAKDQDILDKIFRMKIVDIKNSLMFDSSEAEEEYFKNESYEQYSEEEADYTNMLSNVKTLDLKSIEEKIEDEQRANEKSK
jgi:hypothetical protein